MAAIPVVSQVPDLLELPLDIPAGTLVVVARGRRGEQVGVTSTPCWGPGRWPFVLRWMGDRWTKRPAKARVLRLATHDDLQSVLATRLGQDEL